MKKDIKNNYILGLDLGITSVGWGIVDKDYNVIKYGVRLFEESKADDNLTRRTQRGARRLKQRRQNRINAVKYLLLNNNIIKTLDFEILPNVYELRCKGLNERLNEIELANVLVNIAKRRGSSLEVVIDENDKDALTETKGLAENTKDLVKRNLYVCELQLERYKNGELRGSDNIFKTEDYKKELEKILSNQDYLSKELKDKIVEIVIRRRNFAEGPGSEEFPTPYGSWREIYEDGKLIKKHVNLIDEMRGKCSIFPEEKRIAKCSYEACLFNLLNDLNNLTINKNEYVTIEKKKEIIDYVNKKGNITVKQIIKILGVDEEKITGFRIDKNEKNLISEFPGYKKLLSVLGENHEIIKEVNDAVNIFKNSDDLKVDKIMDILTQTLVVEERIKELKNLNFNLTDEIIEEIANVSKINGYHSLSKKAMDLLIPELLETNDNQMQIISRMDIKKDNKGSNSFDIAFDDAAILSPVTKRVHRQALKVVNELRKEYGEFDSIVIETTRSKNSKEEKDEITKFQKKNEEEKKKIDELLLDMSKNPDDYNLETRLKLRLYKEQEGKTIYAGLPIDLDLLLSDSTAYQIEHIIPYAVSFDNSLNNKALASAKENQDKGKRSPFAYFTSGDILNINGAQIKTWDQFEIYIEGLKGISKSKKEKLLDQNDISKYDNAKEFVARNLMDTSYAIRSIGNTLRSYYKQNEIDTKIFTIKGKFTSAFRNKTLLKKDRDQYIHHAIDALIIAGSKNQKVFNQIYNLSTTNSNELVDNRTGEVIDLNNDPLEDDTFIRFIKSLKEIQGKPEDFSYQVDKKTNRQFADQTIYSTRVYDGVEYIISKYGDIYGKDGESLKKLFNDGKEKSLLVYKNDKQTFDLLKQIYESYKNEKNPFAKYKEEHDYIRKYSKDGNGPIIKQLKYQSDELTTYKDISHNYNVKDKKVVLLSIKPYRIDVYLNKKGIYQVLPIKYIDVTLKNDKNVIDEAFYNNLKVSRKIDEDAVFKFTLNRNDFVKIQRENSQLYKYIGVSVGKNGDTLEFKNIEKATEDRIRFKISKNVKLIEKYNVTPAGKWYKVEKEDLKLEW